MQYGGGGHRFMKLFHKIPLFFEGWLPLPSKFVEKRLETHEMQNAEKANS